MDIGHSQRQRVPAYSCKKADHQVHVPHFMRCTQCAYAWIDCPGEAGVNYKTGCPACSSIYWTAEGARKVRKLRDLIYTSPKVN